MPECSYSADHIIIKEFIMPDEIEPKCYSLLEYLLFKLDRNIAIAGLIAIAVVAIMVSEISEPASKIISACVGGLCVYIGGRGGNK